MLPSVSVHSARTKLQLLSYSFIAANQVVTLTRVANKRVLQMDRFVADQFSSVQFMCYEQAFKVQISLQ